MTAPLVDWTPMDSLPEQTVTCRCGGPPFRSHAKLVESDVVTAIVRGNASSMVIVSRKPCPTCGATGNAYRLSSDPETMTL